MEERELVFSVLKKFENNKIEYLQLNNIFNENELKIINNYLLQDGSLIKMFDRELLKDIVTLTIRGKHLLFIHENEDKIKEYEDILAYQGYNTEYLSDFIKTRDLNDKLEKIFSIEDYDAFTKYTKSLQRPRVTQRLMRIKK